MGDTMTIRLSYFGIIISAALASCTTSQQVATPSDVTLKSAVLELADTFYEAQNKGEGRQKVGLIVDEATVEFNIAAKATNKWNGGAEASGIPINAAALKLSIANESFSEGSRGNKVTVTFKNLATASINKDGLAFLRECLQNPSSNDCKGTVIFSQSGPNS